MNFTTGYEGAHQNDETLPDGVRFQEALKIYNEGIMRSIALNLGRVILVAKMGGGVPRRRTTGRVLGL